MISSGIPESALFFYYDSLAIENGTIQKNEVVVSARDLRGAILEKLPRYGVGPGRIDSIPVTLSAVLFAMEQGKWGRAPHDFFNIVLSIKNAFVRILDFEISVIHFYFFLLFRPYVF